MLCQTRFRLSSLHRTNEPLLPTHIQLRHQQEIKGESLSHTHIHPKYPIPRNPLFHKKSSYSRRNKQSHTDSIGGCVLQLSRHALTNQETAKPRILSSKRLVLVSGFRFSNFIVFDVRYELEQRSAQQQKAAEQTHQDAANINPETQ